MTKKLLTLFAALFAAVLTLPAATESADAVLAKAAQALRSPKSLTAKFTLSSPDGKASGTLILSGSRFSMTSPQMSIWFDGKTQWSYSAPARECNITTPTAEELQQVNPLAVIEAYRRGYTARLTASNATSKRLTLTARSAKADIRTVAIDLDAHTHYPRSITLTDRSGQRVTITVSSVRAGNALPSSTFTFNPKAYKGVEVIDLR